MIMDKIGLIDFTNEPYGRDKRISSNRLKLKKDSFKNITARWTNYLKSKLEEEKKKLVESEYEAAQEGGITTEAQKAISTTASKIALLEATIKVIEKENVPSMFVKRRAIKLKKAMFEQLILTSKGVYVVPESKKEEVFESSQVKDSVPTVGLAPSYTGYDSFVYKKNEVPEVNKEEIDVKKVSDITRDTIISDVNDAMKKVETSPTEEASVELGKDQIIAAIDSEYGKIYNSSPESESIVESTQVLPPVVDIPVPMVEEKEPVVEEKTHMEESIRDTVVIAEDVRENSRFDMHENNR